MATPHTHLPEDPAAHIYEAFQKGLKLLVVGGPSGTFPEKWHRNPEIVIWPSSESKSDDDSRRVPHDIGAILICNMISFKLQRNVSDQAKERGIWMPGTVLSSGAIKRMAEPVLEARKQHSRLAIVEKEPEPMTADVTHARDAMQALVGSSAPITPPVSEDTILQWSEDSIAAIRLTKDAYMSLKVKLAETEAKLIATERELEELKASTRGLSELKALLKNL